MKKSKIGLKKSLLLTLLLVVVALPLYASDYQISSIDETVRLHGDDRYKTAQAIAEQINKGTVDCVVLAPGYNFANALPAGVLAHKNNAPLLLVDSTAKNTKEAFDYIKSHLSKTGKIYLVGDSRLIGYDFIAELNGLGYNNAIRVSGNDKYGTAYLIARELNISDRTPVVISSGENSSDALAVSSFAAAKGWPILLTDGEVLTQSIKNFIVEKQPSEIYITGGEEAISKVIEDELGRIVQNTKITRFAGNSRDETAMKIVNHFAPNPQNIYIASNYLDTLAGSVLAAKTNSPIVFVLLNQVPKRSLPKNIVRYMADTRKLRANTNVIALGGPAVLPEEVFTLAASIAGQHNLTSLGQPVEFSYTIEKDYWWRSGKSFVELEGELSEEQELALLTAVKFYTEWLSIDFRTLDESTFGLQYATHRFAEGEREKITNSKNIYDRQLYTNRVEKLTVSSIGTFYMLQDTPYTYVRIRADSLGYNAERGGNIKRSDTYIVCLYNIHGYWEVDLMQ